MKRPCLVFTAIVPVLILSAITAWGQATAQISGTVRDQSAAVLPGVEITATQTETEVARKTITNETGTYVLSNLPLGPYKLEAALPGFDVTVWQGILAPAGTPREIVTRLHSEIISTLQKPEVQSRMAALGVETIGSSPQEFAEFIKRDIAKWAVVIKASGARID